MNRIKHKFVPHDLPLDPNSCPCSQVKPPSPPPIEEECSGKGLKDITSTTSIQIVGKLETDNVEISIFLQQMVNLFKRTTMKLELASVLPLLLLHPEVPQILTKKEMKLLKDVSLMYDNVETCQTSSTKVSNDFTDLVHYRDNWNYHPSSLTDNVKIYEALKILSSYSEIRKIAKVFRKEIPMQSELFLQYMKFFIEHVITKLRLTPEQERSRELYYRKLWRENAKAKKDLAILTMQLDEQRLSHSAEIEVMDSRYMKDLEMVERINKICSDDMKHSIDKCQRRQVIAYRNSEFKQNDLQQILLNTKSQLKTLCNTNFRMERDMRNKKFKTESQLLALMNKFDTEIGERQKIFEELTSEYALIETEKERLEKEMETQLELVNSFIMEQKEASLKKFYEKLENFIKSRSVKMIQRWWRKIYSRKRFRSKRSKRLKKGKK